jgi:hypothetical protein
MPDTEKMRETIFEGRFSKKSAKKSVLLIRSIEEFGHINCTLALFNCTFQNENLSLNLNNKNARESKLADTKSPLQ